MKKLGLLPKLLLGIIIGILVGLSGISFLTRILLTFSSLFGNFLGFMIPLIIIGFVAPGIAELGNKAGKMLGMTVAFAYISTISAGILAFFSGSLILPKLIKETSEVGGNIIEIGPYVNIQIPALMGVMTALATAFLLGLGMASINSKSIYSFMKEFQNIIEKVIKFLIIPLLPIHIAGIFSKMAYTGEVASTLSVFGRVIMVAIIVHVIYLAILYLIAGTISAKNPFMALKTMLPAYFTAIGTQSSAATIPVTVKSTIENDVSEEVAEFVVPLCATIHLAGSTITLTTCALAVMIMNGMVFTFPQMLVFIMMLGVTMVAAPGVPGGAIMAALGLLGTHLGFNEAHLGIMMALYIAQDSFGTACNVTGDGAIALAINSLVKKTKDKVEVFSK